MVQGWATGRVGQNFCFFSIQEFVSHMQGINKRHEKATNSSSYLCDIKTQATVPSLEHKYTQSEEGIGGEQMCKDAIL